MHYVTPGIHLIARTAVDDSGLRAYLEDIGAVGWESDAPSDVEELIEVMSRSCYKSFGTDLNPNLTRTRSSNQEHLEHILAVNHGSVLEHSYVSFMFTDVSRVFTHELVRHRVGVAISQESLRFVRLNDLGLWIPSCYAGNPVAKEIFERAWRQAEENYNALLTVALPKPIDKMTFNEKKEYTSAARRVAPIGLATNIGWSCNVRELQHVIAMRTSPAAEEEIRLVFSEVDTIARREWPHLFFG